MCPFLIYVCFFLFDFFLVSDIGKVCECSCLGVILVLFVVFDSLSRARALSLSLSLSHTHTHSLTHTHTHTHTHPHTHTLSLSLTHSLTHPHTQGLIPSSPVQETGLEKFTFPAGVAEPAISSWASTMPGRAKGRTKTNQVASLVVERRRVVKQRRVVKWRRNLTVLRRVRRVVKWRRVVKRRRVVQWRRNLTVLYHEKKPGCHADNKCLFYFSHDPCFLLKDATLITTLTSSGVYVFILFGAFYFLF
jgi:hypothetical protein